MATTLEREGASGKRGIIELMKASKQKDPTGITGVVRLYDRYYVSSILDALIRSSLQRTRKNKMIDIETTIGITQITSLNY